MFCRNAVVYIAPYFVYTVIATASKRELMPTLNALRVRLKSRLFLLPLKSFCKQKSFGDTLFLVCSLFIFLSFQPSSLGYAWRNLVVRSAVLFITGFLDYARNDSKYLACSLFIFLSFRPSSIGYAWRNLVV